MDRYGKIVNLVHMLINGSYGGRGGLNFIDATCGNGFDTLFLCKVAGLSGHVKAFDIQEQAIERTRILLETNLSSKNYEMIRDSHEYINKYLSEKIDAVIFNLGYLPFSDKKITTKPDVTLNAIRNLLPLLNSDGRIYITTYVTHDTGKEIKEIYDYLTSLDNNEFNVIHTRIINKENTPPELFIVEKN